MQKDVLLKHNSSKSCIKYLIYNFMFCAQYNGLTPLLHTIIHRPTTCSITFNPRKNILHLSPLLLTHLSVILESSHERDNSEGRQAHSRSTHLNKTCNMLSIQINGYQDDGVSIFHNQFAESLRSQVFKLKKRQPWFITRCSRANNDLESRLRTWCLRI